MPVNLNGYNLSNDAGGLVLGASASRIAAANYGIKDPMLPGMMGSATANNAYKIYPFQVNDVNINTGSPWSTSTFRFTAPVAGIYYMSYSGIVGNGTVTSANGYMICFAVNGANWYFSYKDTASTWELHHAAVMLNLAANDWMAWACNISPGPDAGTNAGAYSANHNTCTIWLVG